jgi:hypothetical protein
MVGKESNKAQIEKFKEAARQLETDDSEEAFDEKLKKVARSSSPPEKPSPSTAPKRRRERS